MSRTEIIHIHGEEIAEEDTSISAKVDLDKLVVEILFKDSLAERAGEDRVRTLKLENVVEIQWRGDGIPVEERWGMFLGWGDEQELKSYAIARASQVLNLDQRSSSEPWGNGTVMKCFIHSTEMLMDLHYLGPVSWTERWQPNSDRTLA